MEKKQSIVHVLKSDDITSVAEAVKESESSIVKIVSDTGASVLKSATSIKIIKKVADKNRKSIVFVEPLSSIKPILSQLKIRAANSIDSPPYIVNDTPLKNEKHIAIDLSKSPQNKNSESSSKTKILEKFDKPKLNKAPLDNKPTALDKDSISNKEDKGIAIPNFDKFRNKSLIMMAGLLSIVALWVVCFKILPAASVEIRLQTDKITTQETINISNTFQSSDFKNNKIKAQKATVEKKVNKTVTTTGSKDIGNKSTGTIKVSNLNSSTTENFQAGTEFKSDDGYVYIADTAFSVEPASVSGGNVVPGSGTTSVTSELAGEDQNLSSGSNLDIVGSTGSFSASVLDLSGGTTESVKVVTQADIDAFKQTLIQPADDEIDAELQRQFEQTMVVLGNTNSVEVQKIIPDPIVGEEADEVNLSATIIYSVFGVLKSDIESLVNEKVRLDADGGEKIYSVNAANIVAKTTEAIDNGLILDINVDSSIGPALDESSLSNEITGLRFSEAVDELKRKPGIVDVDIKLSPFWVNSLPRSSKINYQFEVVDVVQDE